MTVQSGGELADEIDIGVAVEIGDLRALAKNDRQRKWFVEEHRARTAAWQRLPSVER
ncbi:hypothetical protein LJR255_005224 [Pararhizobium sp. LjRoot255]|uniref:hypothetical protein n=1 Tax=Pararhizobium sp. LjRoot255 TaxID=3342298 RepID=UPI003ECD80E5